DLPVLHSKFSKQRQRSISPANLPGGSWLIPLKDRRPRRGEREQSQELAGSFLPSSRSGDRLTARQKKTNRRGAHLTHKCKRARAKDRWLITDRDPDYLPPSTYSQEACHHAANALGKALGGKHRFCRCDKPRSRVHV